MSVITTILLVYCIKLGINMLIYAEPTTKLDDLTEKNLREIQGKFGNLLVNVRTQLGNLQNENIGDDLYLFLLPLLDDPDCLPNSCDLKVIFRAMTRSRQWDYLNFYRLEQVIKHFVPQLTDQMDQYKRDRAGFQVATKIKDFIPKAKAVSDPESTHELLPKQSDPAYFARLSVVLKEQVCDYTLRYLEELWESLASILQLPPLTVVLDVVLKGSVRVVWLFPARLVPQAIEMAQENVEAFRKHPILSVMIGDICVFQVHDEVKGMVSQLFILA